jgi:hypothetical protein
MAAWRIWVGALSPLSAAAVTSYAPEYDFQHVICRAAFAAIDAIMDGGA